MGALLNVTLPVFIVIGAGYLAVWRGLFSAESVDALMKFAQNFAIPCLLFSAISTLDLGQSFDAALLASFYTGSASVFFLAMFGARLLFARPWPDAVAIGFCALFANSVLLGLPISERAFGADRLDANYAIIAVHAPFCYMLGFTAMEIVRNQGNGMLRTMGAIGNAAFHNALMIGIALGFAVNLSGVTLPGPVAAAVDLVVASALPIALFGLGGILVRYRPEGDLKEVMFICALSLALHPAIVWAMGTFVTGITLEQRDNAIITAAMAPGVNAYIFANMYGVAKRVAATSVLLGTLGSILSVSVWLAVLG